MLLFDDDIGNSILFAFRESNFVVPQNLSSAQQYLSNIENFYIGNLSMIVFHTVGLDAKNAIIWPKYDDVENVEKCKICLNNLQYYI